MIRMEITGSKEFMKKFLMEEAFDDFLLVEGSIVTSGSYFIDGHMQKDYFSSEEWSDPEIRPYDFAAWKDRRSVVLAMIKGKKTPAYMKLTLQLKPEIAAQILGDKVDLLSGHGGVISGLMCIVKYDKGAVSVTSGVSYTTFSMDKEGESIWDRQIQVLMEKAQLEYKVL